MDDMKKCAWVRPEAVARIEYLEWTEGDHLRHSKLAGLREDKNPRNVVKEHASSVVSWSKLLALRSIPVLCWIVAIRPLLIDSIQNRFGVADCISTTANFAGLGRSPNSINLRAQRSVAANKTAYFLFSVIGNLPR